MDFGACQGTGWIRSGAGDCAPARSHTTERAVCRIRRLNAASFFMARQGLMASQTPSAAVPRCLTPSASSDWLRSAMPLGHCAPPSPGVRSVPVDAASVAGPASRASVAKSSFGCGVGSSLPAQRRSGGARPGRNRPTNRARKRASGPAVRYCSDSGSFVIVPGLSARTVPHSWGRLRSLLAG
jgi:hypothetical protein